MNKNETMPQDVQIKVVSMFKVRMANFGVKPKSKKYSDLQAEFFSGACCAIDAALENESSCIPPSWYFAIIRGTVIE